MITEAVLMTAAERVTDYIEKCVTKAGAESREEVLELFDTMHQLLPQWVIATCPMLHPDIPFISRNANHVFGYTTDYLIKNSALDKYFNHVHQADQQELYDCVNFLHDEMQAIPPKKHHAYRMILHYRYRRADGQYIYLHDEKATLKLPDSSNLYYALFRDITDEKVFGGVKAEMFEQKVFLKKIKEYRPSAQHLSKREKELLTLIKQGLSTKQIAWHLNISHNTVRNIKSKMFGKYNVSNSIELLNVAI